MRELEAFEWVINEVGYLLAADALRLVRALRAMAEVAS